ncbi:MAG: alpha/beta fold hydrolase [Bdellovibrionales bacterium]
MTIPKQTGLFKASDETKIYYELYGESGPVIILSYGIACLMNHWHLQVEEFAKDHQVLMYDLRGHHKSEMGPADITIELLAKDTVELLRFLFPKDPKAHFWGHSFGAPIAFRCASLFPENVESIVLINGFYKNPFSHILSVEAGLKIIDNLTVFAENAPDLSKWLWANSTDNLIFHYLAGVTGGFNLERTAYKDIEIYSKGLAALSLPNFFNNFKALLQFDGSGFFEDTLCPALIVHGERDGIVPLDQNKILAECLPNATFLEFAEGSHCTQLDLPIELNQAIRTFLKNRL